MSTWEEAEAEAWVMKDIAHQYKENETIWSKWESTFIIFSKTSIYGKRIRGSDAYKRTNANKRVEYATDMDIFRHKLDGTP